MSSTEHSDYDKETLTTREDQDGYVLTNKDDELSAEKVKRGRQSSTQRKSSLASNTSNVLSKSAPDVDLEKYSEKTAATEEEPQDPNIVSWDGPDDPADPLNWSNTLKVINVGLVSGICLVTPLASCKLHDYQALSQLLTSPLAMFAPGVPNLMAEFQSINIELGTFVVSIYVLGFASGPMVLAPLSEVYGRMPIVSVESIPTAAAQPDESSIMYVM